ncbi:MAG: hypothetical protein KatS3mg102_1484 [Planctomycetota bacterium]|nr:MAG: hypothetical protein KatS3mg102_1484 [Planctomycetota bacterium]
MALLVAGVLALGAQGLWGRLARVPGAQASARAVALAPGEAAAWLLLGGLRAVVIAATWVELMQAYHAGAFHEVPPLASVITALDPLREEAWVIGGWTMAVQIPERHGDPRRAWPWIRQGLLHLQRGLERNPGSWRLPYETAMLLLLHVVADRERARALEADRALDPQGLPAVLLALRHLERAARVPAHPAAPDWARLGLLLELAAGAPEPGARRGYLDRAAAVLAHLRADHPYLPEQAFAPWERRLAELERKGGSAR